VALVISHYKNVSANSTDPSEGLHLLSLMADQSHPKSNRSGKLSVILLAYFSESRLVDTTQKITKALEGANVDFEIIIMDDGSTDNTYEIGLALESKDDRIKAYQLSKNYTTNYSKFAGLEVCSGDCAVFVPDDLQRSMDTVLKMYHIWAEGEQIVVDYRTSRDDGRLTDFFANRYYKFMNTYSEVKFPKGGTDGCLMDREIIDLLNERIRPINTSLMVEVLRLGFSPFFMPAERPKATVKSRWTFRKKWRLARDTFFNSSSFPIRLITYTGIFTFIFSCIFIMFLIYAKLFADNNLFGFRVPGWTTSLVAIMLFNGLNLISMAILAEYIWRIFEEVKDRPGYIIKKKNKR